MFGIDTGITGFFLTESRRTAQDRSERGYAEIAKILQQRFGSGTALSSTGFRLWQLVRRARQPWKPTSTRDISA
jgi:hypothetical protein